jgi:hypothetical protein
MKAGKAQSVQRRLDSRSSIPGIGKRFLASPQRPDRLWASPSLLSNWNRGDLSPGVKQQRNKADHSTLSSIEVKNGVAIAPLPVRLHGLGLNELSTGTTLPLPFITLTKKCTAKEVWNINSLMFWVWRQKTSHKALNLKRMRIITENVVQLGH